MSDNLPKVGFGLAALMSVASLFTANAEEPNRSSDCDIIINIPDTASLPNSQIAIPIYLDNFADSVIGFSIWIQTDRPHTVFAFQTESILQVDTTYWKCLAYSGPNCIDSMNVPADSAWDFIHVDSFDVQSANFDTTGTLISGWEYVSTRSFSAGGTDILIVGIANIPGGSVTSGIGAQSGGTLVKIIADVFEDADPFTDSIVNLVINVDLQDHLNFVTTDPNWSPWLPIPYSDTDGFVCNEWDIDNSQNPPETLGCLGWMQTPFPPWDSIFVSVDTNYVLDTTKLCINDGSVKILPPFFCGDLNGDDAVSNILDLTFAVDRVFRGGPISDPPEASDVNCDGANCNILDLTKIVDRIFRGGAVLCNGGWCP